MSCVHQLLPFPAGEHTSFSPLLPGYPHPSLPWLTSEVGLLKTVGPGGESLSQLCSLRSSSGGSNMALTAEITEHLMSTASLNAVS